MPLELAEFITEDGEKIKLIPGLRDRIKPGWRGMFDDKGEEVTQSSKLVYRTEATKVITGLCEYFGHTLKGKRVLEIGCCYGFVSYLMAELGAIKVVGIDIPEYNIAQSGSTNNKESILVETNRLNRLRDTVSKDFSQEVIDRVSFQDLDATQMFFDEEFDVILSLDTLEHIHNPPLLFKAMNRALTKDGFMFHSYNPFFR